jgi:hypothetical protein
MANTSFRRLYYITKDLLSYADENKIISFLYPPHLTQLIQPLNIAVFLVYKHYYSKAVTQSYTTGYNDFIKLEFLDRIHHIRIQILKLQIIISGW